MLTVCILARFEIVIPLFVGENSTIYSEWRKKYIFFQQLILLSAVSTDFLKMDSLSGTFPYSDARLTVTIRVPSSCKLA